MGSWVDSENPREMRGFRSEGDVRLSDEDGRDADVSGLQGGFGFNVVAHHRYPGSICSRYYAEAATRDENCSGFRLVRRAR